MRGTAHRDLPALAADAKHKVPGQKALVALHHPGGHDEAWLVQAVVHVLKNTAHRVHALDLVERVFEPRISAVHIAQAGQVRGCHLRKKALDGRQVCGRHVIGHWGRGRAHGRGRVMRATSGKYHA